MPCWPLLMHPGREAQLVVCLPTIPQEAPCHHGGAWRHGMVLAQMWPFPGGTGESDKMGAKDLPLWDSHHMLGVGGTLPWSLRAIRGVSSNAAALWDLATMLGALCLAVLLGYGECGQQGGDGVGSRTLVPTLVPSTGAQAVAEVPLLGVLQPTDAANQPCRHS